MCATQPSCCSSRETPGPDHICMLETSLLHHESLLTHCQSAYTTHLGVAFSVTRGATDEAILALSTVSIGILPMQFVVSQ